MNPKLHLRDYQQEGVNFLAEVGRSAGLLGDEPGLGKTRQAIAAADTLHARRVLVLCYAIAKSHWQREFSELQSLPRKVLTLNSQQERVPDKTSPLVVILNYDLIQQRDQPLRNVLLAHKWDTLILDEAHVLKSPDAHKTKYIYGKKLDGKAPSLVSQCESVFVLTGTPMPNHAGELWTHFHALAPHLIPDPIRPGTPLSYPHYLDRYATIRATPWGNKITGSKNLQDLNRRLGVFMLRRRKKDVLKDLPPLDFVLYPVTPSVPDTRALKDDLSQLEDFDTIEQLDDNSLEDALGLSHPSVSTARRLLGLAKTKLAVELAHAELDADPAAKLILFAHHQSVLDRMNALFQSLKHRPVLVDGRTPATSRDKAIHDFQNDPNTRVFLGQTTAAGTSITLTASSNVIVVEPSFVPKDNVQAASRAHRFGQKNSVLVRYLYIPGTLDERIIAIIHRKTREIATVLDDDTVNLGAPA